jgi:hypothetical protein
MVDWSVFDWWDRRVGREEEGPWEGDDHVRTAEYLLAQYHIVLYPYGLHYARHIRTRGLPHQHDRAHGNDGRLQQNQVRAFLVSYDTIEICMAARSVSRLLVRQAVLHRAPPPLRACVAGSSTATGCSCLTLPRPFQLRIYLDLLVLIPVHHAAPMSPPSSVVCLPTVSYVTSNVIEKNPKVRATHAPRALE